jgi:hypothetical protein
VACRASLKYDLLREHNSSMHSDFAAITVVSNFVSWVVLVAVVWALIRMRARRKKKRQLIQSERFDQSRYVRGSDYYWRSRNSIGIAPFARQAQGLPMYHDENQWSDPPG